MPFWISLKTAIAATSLTLILGLWAACWMFRYCGRGRGLLDGVLMLPLVLPPTVVGFFLLLLLGRNGLVGQALHGWGLAVIFTWPAIVVAATVVSFPLMYKTVLTALEQVDPTLVSAARTLGATEWTIVWQVLLPLTWPAILAGIVLSFARAIGEFGATLMVGGSIPGVTQTIPIAIYFAAESGRMTLALVWVLVMVSLALLVTTGVSRSGDSHRSVHNYSGRFAPKSSPWAERQSWMKQTFDWIYFGESTTGWNIRRRETKGSNRKASSQQPHALSLKLFEQQKQPACSQFPELAVNLEKQLPDFRLSVSLVACREPLGLLGASGSGKSLTLRCIAGLETPSQGQITLNGRVLFDSSKGLNLPSRDRKVGLVFQNYALFPHLTVAQNIAFAMAAVPRSQRLAQVMSYLDSVELEGLGDRYPHQLSGGQQQRVALARAIAQQPDVLLLDEPLSALDTYLRSAVERLLRRQLNRYHGVTLLVTHKLEEAYRVCPNLMVLSQGHAIAQGSREEVFTHPPTLEVARVTECKNFSRAYRIGDRRVQALDWGCQLEVTEPLSHHSIQLGIRAHHISFSAQADTANRFPGWPASISETQHRVTLYLQLFREPASPEDYCLQAEVYREQWERIRCNPLPWSICLDPKKLMVFLS